MSRDCVINCITVGKFCSSLSRGSVDNASDPRERQKEAKVGKMEWICKLHYRIYIYNLLEREIVRLDRARL